MKKLLLPFLIIALAALAVAFTGRLCGPKADVQSLDRMQDVSWLKGALGLSEAQAAEIKKLQEGYAKDLESCCSRHCEARMKFGDAVFHDSDTNAARAVVESMCKAQAESDLATMEHIRKVHSLLTPDQQKKYEKMVTDCVCSSCPIGMHN